MTTTTITTDAHHESTVKGVGPATVVLASCTVDLNRLGHVTKVADIMRITTSWRGAPVTVDLESTRSSNFYADENRWRLGDWSVVFVHGGYAGPSEIGRARIQEAHAHILHDWLFTEEASQVYVRALVRTIVRLAKRPRYGYGSAACDIRQAIAAHFLALKSHQALTACPDALARLDEIAAALDTLDAAIEAAED
jgi:hypothetical protein